MPIEPVTPPETADEDKPPQAERPSRRPSPGMGKLKEQIAELYVTLGIMVVTPLDRLGGHLMAANADEIADQWIALAETNPSVKRTLMKLVEVGGWGGVVMAHATILLPVLANRGLFPDQVAQGTAAMTMLAHPETQPLFTHARFGTGRENGDGGS